MQAFREWRTRVARDNEELNLDMLGDMPTFRQTIREGIDRNRGIETQNAKKWINMSHKLAEIEMWRQKWRTGVKLRREI